MKTPSDCPVWFVEMIDSLKDEVETAMFKATDPLDTARQVAKLSLLRALIDEIELQADREQEAQKRKVEGFFERSDA